MQQILNYFNISAPLHHEDEEDDFFPELIKVQPQAQAEVDELERQHVHLHKNWDDLSAQLEDLLAGKRENVDRDLIERFVAGYDVQLPLKNRFLS